MKTYSNYKTRKEVAIEKLQAKKDLKDTIIGATIAGIMLITFFVIICNALHTQL